MMYGSSVSKSAGGSLNAMCPFSPMPRNAISMGADAVAFQPRVSPRPGRLRPPREGDTADSRFADQLLHQHFAETARVRDRQPDVFVEMKGLHLFQSIPGSLVNASEELELRGCGGGDDASLSVL